MKILFSSYHNPHFLTVTEYVENAILESGHELIRFDARQFIIPGRLRESIPVLEWADLIRINLNFIDTVRKEKPDLCIIMCGHRIFPGSVRKVKKQGIPIVLWTTDVPLVFDTIKKNATQYDYVFCAGSEAVDILSGDNLQNLQLLPFACDEHLHHRTVLSPRDEEQYQKELAFVGSYYPNRAAILEKLCDYRLGIWGPGWQNLPDTSPLKKIAITKQVSHNEWIKIFSSAKLALVIHYQDGQTPSYQASPKLFEALACQCFVLVDKQKDALDMFTAGKHVVFWNDIDDLKEKVDFYLKHSDLRNAIAREGEQCNKQHHTYKNRLNLLLDTLRNKSVLKGSR
ncbi:MAG: glycosyltransferase [Candidatus Omnitrophica bacterium]|nr:glycosyltransferase [Candidatus Omnitrophota bacterium]